jgi:hypothetical protein
VFAFRSAGAAPSTTLALQAVSPSAQYEVRDVHTGTLVTTASGAALRDGLALTLSPASAEVLSVTPVD